MSETPEERSKRQLIVLINNDKFRYRYSIFTDPEKSSELIEASVAMRRTIRRRHKQPFLLKPSLLRRNNVTQAFMLILTTAAIPDFAEELEELMFPLFIQVLEGPLTENKRQSMIRSIKTQKLHNLKKFFFLEKVKRFTVLNKNLLDEDC